MHTSWQWWEHVERAAERAGRRVVRINCDETSIPRLLLKAKGLVGHGHSGTRVVLGGKDQVQRKGSFTHCCMICDDPNLQPDLPQYILGNEYMMRVQDLNRLRTECASNVRLIRGKSGWMDNAVFISVLRDVSRIVKGRYVDAQILMLLDCASVHLQIDVLRACRRLDICVCFVPRCCTWLMQPCDTHVFRRYKCALRRFWRATVTRGCFGTAASLAVLRALCRTIVAVVNCTDWSSSFWRSGYHRSRRHVSSRIMAYVQTCPREDPRGTPPMPVDIREVLPQRLTLPFDLLVRAPVVPVPVAAMAVEPVAVVPVVAGCPYPVGRPFPPAAPKRRNRESDIAPAVLTDNDVTDAVDGRGLGSDNPWAGRLRQPSSQSLDMPTSSKPGLECNPSPVSRRRLI